MGASPLAPTYPGGILRNPETNSPLSKNRKEGASQEKKQQCRKRVQTKTHTNFKQNVAFVAKDVHKIKKRWVEVEIEL